MSHNTANSSLNHNMHAPSSSCAMVKSSSRTNLSDVWSNLPPDLIFCCLTYFDSLFLAQCSIHGKLFRQAFRQSIEEMWGIVSEWEAYVGMDLPIDVKTYLCAWKESFPIFQRCVVLGRRGFVSCRSLRNLHIPCNDNVLTDLSRDGFICISCQHFSQVHKDWEMYFTTFIDIEGQCGPPGCIVEAEMMEDMLEDSNEVLNNIINQERGRTRYIGHGYVANEYGVVAPDFFTWKAMFSTNQFFSDTPNTQPLPLIWQYCGPKSWMIDDFHGTLDEEKVAWIWGCHDRYVDDETDSFQNIFIDMSDLEAKPDDLQTHLFHIGTLYYHLQQFISVPRHVRFIVQRIIDVTRKVYAYYLNHRQDTKIAHDLMSSYASNPVFKNTKNELKSILENDEVLVIMREKLMELKELNMEEFEDFLFYPLITQGVLCDNPFHRYEIIN